MRKLARLLAAVVLLTGPLVPARGETVCDAYYNGGACCKCRDVPGGRACVPCFGVPCIVSCGSEDGICWAVDPTYCAPVFCDPETEICG